MRTKRITWIVTCILLLLGVGFLVFGALNGEAEGVFRKAVTICMECIGLG
ncbi:MAG: hypothetical protein J5938_03355 [Clostridia bacterium]|nr:hypothetical protein [Clostridia bacterium]